MRLAVLCDFDGTLVNIDTCVEILEKFEKVIKKKNMKQFLKLNKLSGKPDLVVYNDKEFFFVEVKSHVDRIRLNQKLFIHGLILFKFPKCKLLFVYPENLRKKNVDKITWKLGDVLDSMKFDFKY